MSWYYVKIKVYIVILYFEDVSLKEGKFLVLNHINIQYVLLKIFVKNCLEEYSPMISNAYNILWAKIRKKGIYRKPKIKVYRVTSKLIRKKPIDFRIWYLVIRIIYCTIFSHFWPSTMWVRRRKNANLSTNTNPSIVNCTMFK